MFRNKRTKLSLAIEVLVYLFLLLTLCSFTGSTPHVRYNLVLDHDGVKTHTHKVEGVFEIKNNTLIETYYLKNQPKYLKYKVTQVDKNQYKHVNTWKDTLTYIFAKDTLTVINSTYLNEKTVYLWER